MTARGSCLCGSVTFEIAGALGPVVACHCGQCRKMSGHYVAATVIDGADITVSGAISWYQSSDLARRGFCGTCGSTLFWDGPGPELAVMAGSLDGDPGVGMAGHIFCADKGAYYDITDGLPQAADGHLCEGRA
ncbi:GFA family protein [Ponticoccus sp. SC2-23]|uniref:GFA family protein n=1 Tax=Alexandriicola marinus TaxID=2081710 RepID=UPI000FDC7819|nr:GFA family protein [Alexandriicola marinus]MBM1222230.1 GFA family protein [Ponticoccus sp. SC6-9]MBM1226917.1 GFA family protein [Ponticoccus sp. SC6-15]MBM1231177.1 GFA family protein [Ponticoccus sp. SC6-38]MBM1235571.1 GFA family protein [Ponticoccus sp. SC6-45]MBM1240199.1 GFA family protein [Ponticoccus sp. SC6-49]MBM1244553.1 GFA family protein [Ponticoccus sp. SC2-64]MBM1249045.1 GFA family protein [Ponticoccus sp. SC6-42]MBM1253854.1 GFA family protein [Ponticoccus sp. SC6-33]M